MAESREPSDARATSYSVAEAARLLGVTESAVRKRLERGVLTAVPADRGRLRVDARTVEDERLRFLSRLDAPGLGELEQLQHEVARLTEALDRSVFERNRLQAAIESLLQAHAALRDTVSQLVAEGRIIDS